MSNPRHQHCSDPARGIAAPDLFLGALGVILLLIARISFDIHVDVSKSWKSGKFAKSKQTQLGPALAHRPRPLCFAPHSSPTRTRSNYPQVSREPVSFHRSSPHLLAYSIARRSCEAHSGTSHDSNSAIQRTQVEGIDGLRLETRTSSVYRASEIIDDDVQVTDGPGSGAGEYPRLIWESKSKVSLLWEPVVALCG